MPEAAVQSMSGDDFLSWSKDSDDRWEWVDRAPVGMAGAGRAHNRIVFNISGLLYLQLKGKPCQGFTSDTLIRIPNGNYRLPDTGVDCGESEWQDRFANNPRLVVEVLSPSTRQFDMFGKLEEYKIVETLRYILLVDSLMPRAALWSREDTAWSNTSFHGLEHGIDLPALQITLPMDDIYDQVMFPPKPQLVPWTG